MQSPAVFLSILFVVALAFVLLTRVRSYQVWMAWRSIITRSGRGLSFMTMISLFGVAVGVSVLVIVISVMGGMERELKKSLFKGRPHIEVFSSTKLAGFSYRKFDRMYFSKKFPGVQKIEPFTKVDIIVKRGKHIVSAKILGIEPEGEGQIWSLGGSMIQGRVDDLVQKASENVISDNEEAYEIVDQISLGAFEDGLLIGEGLAGELSVGLGDVVQILSPQAGLGDVLTGGTISRAFKIVGVYYTGQADFDMKYVVTDLSAGRRFMADYDYSLDEDRYVSGVALRFERPGDVDKFSSTFLRNDGMDVLSWKEANSSLLFALLLEKFTMAAILLLIVVVAAFSISGTMMMNVFHKRSQVSLLRSVGMSRKDIFKLFLLHGNAIGLLGVFCGLVIGLGVCKMLPFISVSLGAHLVTIGELLRGVEVFLNDLLGLNISFDGVNSYLGWVVQLFPAGGLPFLAKEYLIIALSAWCLSLLAALYPAVLASKQDPGLGLRCL